MKYTRHYLRTKDVESILREASQEFKLDLKKILGEEMNMERMETDFAEVFLIEDRPLLFKKENKIFPTLVFNEVSDLMPKVVVDMGAVPHVCNGADVMAPGIVHFEGEFTEGELVYVVDEEYGKKIAVGRSVKGIEVAKKASKGVVIETIHYVGDKIWNFMKKKGII